MVAEKRGTAKEIDQSLQLTQKDTQLKQSRKEVAQVKAQVLKLKEKNKQLKASLDQIPQKPSASNQLYHPKSGAKKGQNT